MHTQNSCTERFHRSKLIGLLLALLCSPALANPRKPTLAAQDFYRFGQEFLRALYPELDGKQYAMSIESAVLFDDPVALPYRFSLYVGEGPKFIVTKCCFGGYISHDVIGLAQLPPPPELPPSPPPTPPPSKPLPWPKEYDASGASHPKQYLSTGFLFDKQGRLIDFGAEGTAVDDHEADKRIYDIVHAHPEMTDAEVIATLKQNGVKYGPNDKEEFIKSLPLQKLEPLLGKLKLESVTFHPLAEYRSTIDLWPDWTVKVSAKQKDGTVLRYEMSFNRLKGALFGLSIVPTTPDKPAEK